MVFSPLYFLLSMLSSGYGCRVAGKYVEILMYADDLLLISASIYDLRKMIEICEGEMVWLDMCFNVNKSCLLSCGPRYKKPCAAMVLNGNLLPERRLSQSNTWVLLLTVA